MAVNNNFYVTVNELMQRATNGTIATVVDYSTFVDAGKTLMEMETSDLVNEFLNPLMNKVQKTINDNPSYVGSLVDMYTGKLDYGVLETIMSSFYEMSASTFDGDTLTDGQIYTDQFKYSAPSIEVTYHMESGSYELDKSIRDTDLRGAFTSPAAMDAFISSIFVGISNSIEHAKEVSRLGLLASAIVNADTIAGESVDETKSARKYNLVTIYNAKHGTELTSATAIENDDFVKWATLTINDIAGLMVKPSDVFNEEVFKTFTPAAYLRLKINGIFEKAIKRAVIGAYNPANMVFDVTPENLPYWQLSGDRLRVTKNTEAESETAYTSPVIACLYDKRALLEMVQLEGVENTRNAKRRYTTYHYQLNKMYARNKFANFVIFTLN